MRERRNSKPRTRSFIRAWRGFDETFNEEIQSELISLSLTIIIKSEMGWRASRVANVEGALRLLDRSDAGRAEQRAALRQLIGLRAALLSVAQRSVSLGDLDNNGTLDAFVTRYNAGTQVAGTWLNK